jgi:hypothetical protein
MIFTKEAIAKLSEDFVDDYLTTPELQQRFIDQVFNYADGCCETDQELFCYIDGLLTNFL